MPERVATGGAVLRKDMLGQARLDEDEIVGLLGPGPMVRLTGRI